MSHVKITVHEVMQLTGLSKTAVTGHLKSGLVAATKHAPSPGKPFGEWEITASRDEVIEKFRDIIPRKSPGPQKAIKINDKKDLWTVQDIAAALDISESTIYKRIKEAKPEPLANGRLTYYRLPFVKQLAEEFKKAEPPATAVTFDSEMTAIKKQLDRIEEMLSGLVRALN